MINPPSKIDRVGVDGYMGHGRSDGGTMEFCQGADSLERPYSSYSRYIPPPLPDPSVGQFREGQACPECGRVMLKPIPPNPPLFLDKTRDPSGFVHWHCRPAARRSVKAPGAAGADGAAA